MLGADDPLAALATIVRGYASVSIRSRRRDRGAVRAERHAARRERVHRRRTSGGSDPTTSISTSARRAIRRTLPRLAAHSVRARRRPCCATRPDSTRRRQASASRTWLTRQRAHVRAGARRRSARRTPTIVLDLSVASPLVSGDPTRERGAGAHERAFARDARARACALRSAATTSRACSTSRRCSRWRRRPIDERRTIHLGLDLFCRRGHAGARAAAPAWCTRSPTTGVAQDYGPVIILRHTTDDGTRVLHALRPSEPRVARRARSRPRHRRAANSSRRSARRT